MKAIITIEDNEFESLMTEDEIIKNGFNYETVVKILKNELSRQVAEYYKDKIEIK